MRSETSAVHGQPKRAKPNAKPMLDSVLCLRASWWDADTCPVSSFCHAPYDKNRKQSQGGMCHSSRFVHKVVGTSPILPQLACLGWFQVGLQSTPKGGCATTRDELSGQVCVFKRLKFRCLLTCKDVCRSSHSWPIYGAFCARQPKTTQGPTNAIGKSMMIQRQGAGCPKEPSLVASCGKENIPGRFSRGLLIPGETAKTLHLCSVCQLARLQVD